VTSSIALLSKSAPEYVGSATHAKRRRRCTILPCRHRIVPRSHDVAGGSDKDLLRSEERAMYRFIIEREVPGFGKSDANGLAEASTKSKEVVDRLGPGIQWVTSYVTDDKIYCVYLADDERLVLQHARESGFPANRISIVRTSIDPTTARAPVPA
jgi:hypothetical protein